jgi:hypothetical protein
MARKAIVDRATVLEMLKEGKTSQAVADRFGVSRQAIDLYRKQFVRDGSLPTGPRSSPTGPVAGRPANRIADEPRAPYYAIPPSPPPPSRGNLSLDQAVDLFIQAFTALKQVPELEQEIERLKKTNVSLTAQFEEAQTREQKRREQEQRWFQAQNPGVLTHRPPASSTDPPPQTTSSK